jgi:hypothetical protein
VSLDSRCLEWQRKFLFGNAQRIERRDRFADVAATQDC